MIHRLCFSLYSEMNLVRENEEIFDEIKEEGNMCEALRELMEPEIKEELRLAEERGKRTIILNALKAGNSVEDISRIVQVSVEEIEAMAKGE